MVTTCFFIRHGDVVNPLHLLYGRIRDIPLSEEGIEQVKKLGMLLQSSQIVPTSILTSPLLRTRETATILQKIFPRVPIKIKQELTEVETFHYVGRSGEFAKRIRNPYAESNQQTFLYTIESSKDQCTRMRTVVEKAVLEYSGNTFFVVSHGDPISFLVDSLEQSTEGQRTIDILKDVQRYILRGEAWKIEFDSFPHIRSLTKMNTP